MQPKPQRPGGVTILGILAIIGGVLGILGGGLLLGASPTLVAQSGLSSGAFTAFGVVGLLFGILGLVFGIGALQLAKWAWSLGVGLYALNIIDNIIVVATHANSIGGIAINTLLSAYIIYYLFRPNVQQAFGRS